MKQSSPALFVRHPFTSAVRICARTITNNPRLHFNAKQTAFTLAYFRNNRSNLLNTAPIECACLLVEQFYPEAVEQINLSELQ